MNLNEFKPQFMPDDICRALKSIKRHTCIGRIKQAVELRAACIHLFGHCKLGQAFGLHCFGNLQCDYRLNGTRRDIFTNTLLIEPALES